MKAKNPSTHCLLAAVLLACLPLYVVRSQSPATAAEPAPRAGESAASHCVLLQNGNVLFGDARQVGEFVIVRTGSTGEVRLPRSAVACWAGSIRDLYQYRKDHRFSNDIATHLRDARWCLRYDQFDLVAQEIRAIRKVDPNNLDAQRIEDQLERLTSPRSEPPNSPPGSPELQRVAFQESDTRPARVDPVALRLFARHVQPMLLSRCGRCHDAANRSEGWNLVIPTAGARASARMTRENLQSSMLYVDASQPEQSELFIKATNPHGGSPDLLGSRSAKAVESLRQWIGFSGAVALQAENVSSEPPQTGATAIATEIITQPLPAADSPPAVPVDAEGGPPARLPQVSNPFDPEIFNRRFHLDSSNAK